MSKPDVKAPPPPPQPDAPAATAVFGQEDSPAAANKKRQNMRKYFTASASQPATPSGVGVNL